MDAWSDEELTYYICFVTLLHYYVNSWLTCYIIRIWYTNEELNGFDNKQASIWEANYFSSNILWLVCNLNTSFHVNPDTAAYSMIIQHEK